MKTQHTELPYRIGDAGHTIFGPPNGNPSPIIVASNLTRSNAKFIVRACNSHYELVEALKECITDPNAHCLVTDTRDALFKRIEAINTIARKAFSQATK